MTDKVYFRFIEAKIIFEGGINATDFANMFGIKRQAASRVIAKYKAANEGALIYKPIGAGSKYTSSKEFQPKFLKGDAEEFLTCLHVAFKD